tara:strand:- start:48 stop:1061 length:1014 start_codon:yes stop_codon:yes gene_type:complete
MAKQKSYSNDEDLMLVPLDQEVLVSLETGDASGEPDKPEKKAAKESTSVQAGDDDTVETLEKQIEDLRESNKATQQQLLAEQRERRRVEQAAQEIVQDAVQYRTAAERGQHSAIKSALDAAQAEQESSKKDYASFLEAGDFVNAAEAQQKMSRAAAKVLQVERDLGDFDSHIAQAKERAERQPVQREAARPVDVLTSIDTNPNWLPSERVFLKAHPELLTDTQKNAELGVAYNRAMSEKLSRGTPEYFEFIENFMGFKKTETRKGADEEDDQPAYGAPVRRENQGNRQPQRASQIKLTSEQREMARNMGISEIGYARQLQKLQGDKVTNPEKYNQSR